MCAYVYNYGSCSTEINWTAKIAVLLWLQDYNEGETWSLSNLEDFIDTKYFGCNLVSLQGYKCCKHPVRIKFIK